MPSRRLMEEMALAELADTVESLGVQNDTLISIPQSAADSLGLGEQSMSAKRAALQGELHRATKEQARAGKPMDPEALIQAAAGSEVGRQIISALGED